MNEQSTRKAYSRPRLVVYGDIRALTLANPTANNKNDPGSSNTTKT
jgi:hypothetical protein